MHIQFKNKTILGAAFCLCIMGTFAFHALAQDSTQVDMKKIRYRKVRKMITQCQHDFDDLQISVRQREDIHYFKNYEKSFLIKYPSDFVWDNYIYSNQTDSWNLQRVNIELLYCPASRELIYKDQMKRELLQGQVYFLNLKLLKGLFNLPVAFKVLKVDPDQKQIVFSYLKGGKARGRQVIQFVDTHEGYTRIIHSSFVYSGSQLRDRYLYPYFHNKLIAEFHSNMRRQISQRYKQRQKTLARAL